MERRRPGKRESRVATLPPQQWEEDYLLDGEDALQADVQELKK